MNKTGLASNSFQPSGKHANKLNVTCFFGSISIIRPFKKRTKLHWKPQFEIQ